MGQGRLKILHYCRKNKGGGTVGQTDIGAVHRCLRPGQGDRSRAGKIRRAKKRQEQDAVKGSSHDFPYTMQTYRIEGLAYASLWKPEEEDRLEEVLKERLRKAARIKQDVEVWINTIPVRMQRIIRYRIFEGMTWEQVAIRMGRGATGDSVRVEYVRFMNVS